MSGLAPLDRARLARSVAALRGAGWPAGKALAVTAGALPAGEARTRLVAIASSLSAGAAPESGADPLFRLLARGDQAGPEALVAAARDCESQELARAHGRAALAYPLALLISASVLLVFAQNVIPVFARMFVDFGSALPAPTNMLLNAAPALRVIGLLLIALAVGAMLAWTKLADRLPGARAARAAAALHRYVAALRGGIPAADALAEVGGSAGSIAEAPSIRLDSRERALLRRWIETTDPVTAASALAEVMETVADREVTLALRVLPVLAVGSAMVFVGLAVIALYLPIFTISGTL